jgi:hypothetical protein
MDKIDCIAKIVENKIVIEGLNSTEIKIDISGDIDFTNIVSVLSGYIDKSPQIDLLINDEDSITDEKHKLIIETLKDIFNKYTKSINSSPDKENGEDDIE